MRFSAVALGFEVRDSATWSNVVKYAYAMCKKYQDQVIFIRENGQRYASFKWSIEANDMIPA